jgi:hypothetical protein
MKLLCYVLTEFSAVRLILLSHFFNESLPLLLGVSAIFFVHVLDHNEVPWEPVFVLAFLVGHEDLPFDDHVELGNLRLRDLLVHAVFVAASHDCNHEVHEHDVAHDHNYKPEQPSEDLVITIAEQGVRVGITLGGLKSQ